MLKLLLSVVLLSGCGGLPPLDPSAASFGTLCKGLLDTTTCGADNICALELQTDPTFQTALWSTALCSRPCGAGCPSGTACVGGATGYCFRMCNEDADCAAGSGCRIQPGYVYGCVPSASWATATGSFAFVSSTGPGRR